MVDDIRRLDLVKIYLLFSPIIIIIIISSEMAVFHVAGLSSFEIR